MFGRSASIFRQTSSADFKGVSNYRDESLSSEVYIGKLLGRVVCGRAGSELLDPDCTRSRSAFVVPTTELLLFIISSSFSVISYHLYGPF